MMKLKKKEINEIIDGHGDLIGTDDIPTNGSDLESQAKGTSSKNAKIGTQPFRYDMLGRFGFTLMPFMEGEERNEGQEEFKNDLVDLMYEKYLDFLKYYFKNPNKLKPDYRKHVIDNGSPENTDKEWAEKVIKIVQKHFEEALNDIETIDEGVIAEKMVDKKEDEMAEKSEDKELRDKKIKKIAGLINKLEKKDIDDLINLIERENG